MSSAFALILPILLVVLTSFVIQIILMHSPIDPAPLELFPPVHTSAPNKLLQTVEKLGEGMLSGPEDIAVDRDGKVYTATHDGWVKRMWPNGSWESWMYIGGRPLGLRIGLQGEILAAEPTMGLLNITDGKVSVLSTEAEGINYMLTDELVVTKEGLIYFTDASTKFGYESWFLDVLEARTHGRLVKYDPSTGRASVELNGLAFANGLELSEDEDYLVVCETWKFRCLKYWLEGESKGTTEIFVDRLPGGPDNIHRNADGTFWIALISLRSPVIDIFHRSPLLKRLAAGCPYIVNRINPVHKKAAVMKVTTDGKRVLRYEDPEGKTMTMVTTALQDGNNLYIGSLDANFVGRIQLD